MKYLLPVIIIVGCLECCNPGGSSKLPGGDTVYNKKGVNDSMHSDTADNARFSNVSVKQLRVNTLDQVIAIKRIRDIFEDYKKNEDGIDSDDNKNTVTKCLQHLQAVKDARDLELLINLWLYYDPTDYSCRELVLNVLQKDTAAGIAAVKHRIKNKMSWEGDETEFPYLLKALEGK